MLFMCSVELIGVILNTLQVFLPVHSAKLVRLNSNYSAYQNQLIDIDFDETDMSDY